MIYWNRTERVYIHMYVYVCVCMYIYIYIIFIYMCVYVRVCIYKYIHMSMCNTCICRHTLPALWAGHLRRWRSEEPRGLGPLHAWFSEGVVRVHGFTVVLDCELWAWGLGEGFRLGFVGWGLGRFMC